MHCYRYSPSTSSSTCPISYFALTCNFEELAKNYPEFENALTGLKHGRKRKLLDDGVDGEQRSNNDDQACEIAAKEVGVGNCNFSNDEKETSPTAKASPPSKAFSSQITHSFNASLTRSLLHRHFQIVLPSLPEGNLCPPIPNRGNYVCWLKQLLGQSEKDLVRFNISTAASSSTKSSTNVEDDATDDGDNSGTKKSMMMTHSLWQCRGIDIGTGVSAIYPLLLTTNLFTGGDDESTSADPDARNTEIKDDDNDAVSNNNMKRKRKMMALQQQPHHQKLWKFLATDIDPLAIQSARTNVQANHLEDQIHIIQVVKNTINDNNEISIHKGPLFAAMEEAKKQSTFFQPHCHPMNDENDERPQKELTASSYPKFDFVMTNPPFYSTLNEATAPRAGDKRCRTDMSANEGVYQVGDYVGRMDDDITGDNGGGDNDGDGGDVGFITAIMNDSQYFRHHVTWYTSLVARRSSLDVVLRRLQTLNGVWGNRGQIRTVEFRQGNLLLDVDGGSEKEQYERNDKNGNNPRVRWGVGWSYERAVGRCGACRVMGGLQSFEVCVSVSDDDCDDVHDAGGGGDNKADKAADEVESRLMVYFEGLRDVSLKCSRHMRECANTTSTGINDGPVKGPNQQQPRRCVTALEGRFFNCNPSRLPLLDHEKDNDNLPYEGHFIMDAFVESTGKCNAGGDFSVQVILEMYSHTKHGSAVVKKIRGSLQGEIGRTNRRWRRLLKRQLKFCST